MKKISKPLVILSTLAAASTHAMEVSEPKLHLFASAGVLDAESSDFDPEAFEFEVGLSGLVKTDEYKMKYQLVADVSSAINSRDTNGRGSDGNDDIHIKEAKLIFPTEYGVFVLAPRSTSGIWREVYGGINAFEYNEPHSGGVTPTGNPIFGQADEGQDIVAYVTPKLLDKRLHFVASTLSIVENNDNDVDVLALRAIWKQGPFRFGVSRVEADRSLAGAGDDYVRYATSAAYNFGSTEIAALFEKNEDTFGPAGDFDSYGLVGKHKFNTDWSLALGYFDKDSEVDSNDDSGYVTTVRRHISDRVSLWAEVGRWDKADDNIALGVNFKY